MMARPLGIAINAEDSIAHWIRAEGHTRSEILASGLTCEKARDRDGMEATERGCRQELPRPRVSGAAWSVHHDWGGH